MYKPNFCAECGAKVFRARWRWWTSRRFCADCAPRLRRRQILATLFGCVTLLTVGVILGRNMRPAPPPLTLQRVELPPAATGTYTSAETSSTAYENSAADSSSAATKPESEYGADGTATERPTDPNEIVSICGARTQKGTPCRRRVRGTGRCWQHRGLPAMLPPQKLVVTGQ